MAETSGRNFTVVFRHGTRTKIPQAAAIINGYSIHIEQDSELGSCASD